LKGGQAVEETIYFVIPSEARNLSGVQLEEKKERFLASLGMTKIVGVFLQPVKPIVFTKIAA
jgi:hypothetical protein